REGSDRRARHPTQGCDDRPRVADRRRVDHRARSQDRPRAVRQPRGALSLRHRSPEPRESDARRDCSRRGRAPDGRGRCRITRGPPAMTTADLLDRLIAATPYPPETTDADVTLAEFNIMFAERQALTASIPGLVVDALDPERVSELAAREQAW